MPDYDNKKRPGEDSTIEPETEDTEDKKHLVIPVSDGVLEIDSDKAVFHTWLNSMSIVYRTNGSDGFTENFPRQSRWNY